MIDVDKLKKRKAALYQERQSWDARAKECSKFVLPRAGRFAVTDRNKGDNRYSGVYDNAAIRANRVLAAGMMAGMTSPARPWFRLATPDPKLMEVDAVRLWLDSVTKLMRTVFAKSNLYKTLHSMYEELGCFGTAAAYVCKDFDSLVHSQALTFGEYAVAQNSKGRVDTLFREYQCTVGQLVDEFGIDACSESVKAMHSNGRLDQWVTVTHAVYPRNNRDVRGKTSKDKRFASVYFESSATGNRVLRESGYDQFPFVVPRWVTSGGDIYGTGPAHEALGPIKQLQHQQLRKSQAIDYKTNPPLQMPAGYRTMEVNTLPGGVSYVDMSTQNGGIRSAFEVQLDLSELGQDIVDVRRQIESTFYSDLFLMLANDDRSGVTAREISERHEEKMLMLGPVLERLHNELIEPLIDLVFEAAVGAVTETGPLLPPAPDELDGMELKVDFISTLAQAQKQIGLSGIERLFGFAGQLAQAKPEVLDKIDADQALDIYGDLLGTDPAVILSDDKVAVVRAQRQQQQLQQEQMAQMAQMAKPMDQMAGAAQKLGGTTAGEGTALDAIMQGLQGYG